MKAVASWLVAVFACLISSIYGADYYHVQNLGSVIGTANSYAHGINDSGHVVGYFQGTNGLFRAFLLRAADWIDLGLAGTNTYALSLNGGDHVVGYMEGTNVPTAFHFQGTSFADLGLLGGISSYAHGINDLTNIVGYIDTTNGAVAISYQAGVMTILGGLGGTNSFAFGINNSNLIVGASLTATSNVLNAFIYGSSGITNLNDLVSSFGWLLNEARGINAAGNIVGWGRTNGIEHAFFLEGTNISDIALFPGGTNSYALSLNDSNVVVGASTRSNTVLNAFLWQNGNLTNLNDLLPPDTGWELIEARGINNSGQIVGWGKINNQEQAFLLSPNQRPAVTVSSPTNGSSLIYPSVIGLSASASDPDGTLTKVEFLANGILIGTDNSSPYSLDWLCSTGGTYQIIARATDDSGGVTDSSAITVSFYGPPTVLVTSPTNNTQFLNITNIAVSITATNPLSTVTNIGFYVDGLLYFSNTTVPWNLTWTNSVSGSFTLTARAQDSDGFSTISEPVDIVVYQGTNSPPSSPAAPSGLTVESLSPQQVSLRWSNASTGLVTKIERKNPGEARFYVVGVSQTGASSFLDTGLSTNTTYIYRVRAANPGGFSSYSSEVSVTTDRSGDVLALSSLELWLRADAGLALSGSSVAAWQDQGGKALSVSQANSSARPGYSSTGFQNLPTLTLNGNQFLTFTSSNLLSAGSPRTIIIVGRTTSGSSGGAAVTFRRTGVNYCFLMLNFLGTFYMYSDGANAANNASAPWGGLDKTFSPFVSVAKSGPSGTKPELSIREENLAITQSGSIAAETGSTGFTIGGREDMTGYNWRGDLAEVLVFSSKLSNAEQLAFERLLLRKYQMASSVSNLVADALSGSQTLLSWKNVNPKTNTVVTVERKIGTGGTYSVVGQVTNRSSYIDTGLTAGTAYVYRVKASFPYMGDSEYSNEASVNTPTRSDWPLADLNLWLQGDRVSGSPAGGWEDQSWKKNDAVQANASYQPTLLTNLANGWPAVHFDGTNDTMRVTNRAGTNSFTVMVVARTTAAHEIDGEVKDGLDGYSGQRFLFAAGQWGDALFNTTNAGINLSVGTNGISYYTLEARSIGVPVNWATAVQPEPLGSGFNLIEFSVADKAPSVFLNGSFLRRGLRSSRDVIYAPVQLGGYEYGYFQGDVADVMIFGKTLSIAEKEPIYAYLNARYGLITNQPGAPSGLMGSGVSPSQISLVWTNSGSNVASVYIERKAGAEGSYEFVTALPATRTSFLDGSLFSGTEYFYRVRGHNLAGYSDYSTETSATTLTSGESIPIEDLTLWLKADGNVNLSSSNNVGAWLDESGKFNDAKQLSTNSQPVWVANQANGRPVIRFDGTNDAFSLPISPATNEFTIFFVARSDTSHEIDSEASSGSGGDFGQRYVVSCGVDAQTINSFLIGGTGGGGISLGTNGVSYYETQRNSVNPQGNAPFAVCSANLSAGFSLVGALVQNHTPSLYVNGSLARVGLSGLRTNEYAPVQIGGYVPWDPAYFKGDIAEILIFKTALSAAQRVSVERYLNFLYAIVDQLPGTPAISTIADHEVDEDTNSGPIGFTISDPDTPVGNLTLSVFSSNTNVVLAADIQLAGSGTNWTASIQPRTNCYGAAQIRITVTDPDGNLATSMFMLNVLPINDAPVAFPQVLRTFEENSVAFQLVGTDVEYDDLTFTVVDQPSHGDLSGAGSNFTYTPATNYFGTDTITFKANDGALDSALATITIEVIGLDDAPAPGNQSFTVPEDTLLQFSLPVTDVDGDALTYSIVEQPAHGILRGVGPAFQYLPDENFNGTDSLKFTASDGISSSGTTTATITVQAVNDPPIFSLSGAFSVDEDFAGTNTIIVISAAVPSDEAGQTIGYSLAPETVPFVNISVNTNSGAIEFTAVANAYGSTNFTLTGVDPGTGSNSFSQQFTFAVLPVSDAPSVTISNPVPSQIFTNPTSISIAGTVSAPDAEIRLIQLMSGTNLIAETTDSSCSFVLTNFPSGLHEFVIRVEDELGFAGTSAPVSVQIQPPLDSDFDGRTDFQELTDSTDPVDPNDFSATRLLHLSFDADALAGDENEAPLAKVNVASVASWSNRAVSLTGTNIAILSYRDIEESAKANITLKRGTMRFWFSPSWSSSNGGGSGPGERAVLVSAGDLGDGDTNQYWALIASAEGNNVSLVTRSNQVAGTNLTAEVTLKANIYHELVLSYSETNTSFYLNGVLVTNGMGVDLFPDADVRAKGWFIGTDSSGARRAQGIFEEFEAFNYVLSTTNIASHYEETAASVDSDLDGLSDSQETALGSDPALADSDNDGIPDGWEHSIGTDPLVNDSSGDSDGDGISNYLEYLLGRNPNIPGSVADSENAAELKVFSPQN